jgi:uncharacterized protein YraI
MLLRKKMKSRYLGTLMVGLVALFLALFILAPSAHADGASCSWRGSYWNNKDLSGEPVLQRCDEAIDFDWHGLSPDVSINVDNFSARWVRTYQFAAGTYRFQATMDDGMRVWVDGHIIIDDWNEANLRTDEADVNLKAGPHKITVEYFEKGGNAVAGFTWVMLDGQPMPPIQPPSGKPMPPTQPPTGQPMPPSSGVIYPTAEVKASYLNVRSGPGVDNSVVGVLRQNAQVHMVGRDASGKWVLIRTDGLSGWVNRYYLHTDFPFTSLSFVTAPGQPTQPSRPEPPSQQYDAMVNASSLNVRSGPGVQYRPIAVVHGGTGVYVISRNANGWVQIQIPGSVTGWVNGSYLTFR